MFKRALRLIVLPQYRPVLVFLIISTAFLTLARPRVSVFIANTLATAGVGGTLLIGLIVALVSLTMLALTTWVTAMTIRAASAISREQPLSALDLFHIDWRTILKLFAVYMIYSLSTGLGFLLLVVPGAIVFVWWYFAPILTIVEGVGIKEAFLRSRELTRGRFWWVGARIVMINLAYILPLWIIGRGNSFTSDLWTGTYPFFSLLSMILFNELTNLPDKPRLTQNEKLVVPKR